MGKNSLKIKILLHLRNNLYTNQFADAVRNLY